MARLARISPCLWFDDQAEDAARFYCDVFPGANIGRIARYGEAGRDIHGRPPGSVMTVDFELCGQPFTALNGGPIFRFSEAISLQVFCATQDELDAYWDKLSAGGPPDAQQCGWLKDRYGLSWQIVPEMLADAMAGDPARAERVMLALLRMKKLDIAELKHAYEAG